MSVGRHESGRDYCDLQEARQVTRDVIRRMPTVTHAQWRDYCGVNLGLPVDEYVDAGDVKPRTVQDNVRRAREGILDFLEPDVSRVAGADYLAVEIEGQSARERADARDISRSAVRSNVRTVRDRLPMLVDELEREA